MKKEVASLLRHHVIELERIHAEAWNPGAFVDPPLIESKTSKGRLRTERDRDTGRVTHVWSPTEN